MSAKPGDTLVAADDLAVRFVTRAGPVQAVRSVSLTLSAGRCLAIVGESGSGKSVTARALVGLAGPGARVSATRLWFDGEDLLTARAADWRRLRGARIGFVLQDALTSLDPLRTIGAEVAEPLAVHGVARARERDARVQALLSEAGIPDPGMRARQYPHELSGGLRQRALIASAIAAGPSLLIADEPTTALDVTIQAQVLELLAGLKAAGTGILLISHDLAVVARLADRIAVMYDGRIVEEGPSDKILSAPSHPYTAHLLAAAPAFGGIGGQATALVPAPADILAAPTGGPGCPYAARCPKADSRCLAELPPLADPGGTEEAVHLLRCWHSLTEPPLSSPPAWQGAPPRRADTAAVLEVQGISKRFRSPDGSLRPAVDGISFTLRAGESLGLVGESGSGKTTTAQIVLGMIAPDAGRVLLGGAPWTGVRERQRRKQRSKIQIVYQDPLSSFDPRFTVGRIIGEALGSRAASKDRVVELLGQVGLDQGFLRRRPLTLSGGQRQRVAIARALAPGPEIIVCDEPVSALDVSVQAQILGLFARLRRELEVALLFISHDLGVVRQVCDRMLVMRDGAIVETGNVETVFSAPQHPYTRSLLDALPQRRPSVSS